MDKAQIPCIAKQNTTKYAWTSSDNICGNALYFMWKTYWEKREEIENEICFG